MILFQFLSLESENMLHNWFRNNKREKKNNDNQIHKTAEEKNIFEHAVIFMQMLRANLEQT